MKKLTELDAIGRRELVSEIRGWSREVATRKGVELWQRAVIGWCEGKGFLKDDRQALDPGKKTKIQRQKEV